MRPNRFDTSAAPLHAVVFAEGGAERGPANRMPSSQLAAPYRRMAGTRRISAWLHGSAPAVQV
jgi:hypothetical protein